MYVWGFPKGGEGPQRGTLAETPCAPDISRFLSGEFPWFVDCKLRLRVADARDLVLNSVGLRSRK